MIGLTGLQDGGHVLEHPAGPLYVWVTRGRIVFAEIARWGSPTTDRWTTGNWSDQLPRAADEFKRGVEGVIAAGPA